MTVNGPKVPRGIVDRISAGYMRALCIVSLLVYMLSYMERGSALEPIRSDGAGYYAYLPSYLIYCDPSFEMDAKIRYGGEFPVWTKVERLDATGRYLNTYNIGVSLMMAPFFMVGHAVTWIMRSPPGAPAMFLFNHAMDGYTLFYQHAAGLAGLFYFLCAIAILKRVLDERFGRLASLLAITGITFGTNLLYYGTAFTVNAHAYTFVLLSILIWHTPRWFQQPEDMRRTLLMGAILVLLYLVRPVNVLFCLFVPLFGLKHVDDIRDRFIFAWKHRKSLMWMGLVVLVGVTPQLLVWKYAADTIFVNAYRSWVGFMMPDVLNYLVGLRRGVFIWFPVTLMACVGMVPLYQRFREWFWPILVLSVVHTVVSSSYYLWRVADGFGCRYIVDMVVLLALPLAALFAGMNRQWHRVITLGLYVGFMAWSIFLMKLFFTREVSPDGLDWAALYDIAWWRAKTLMEWWRGL